MKLGTTALAVTASHDESSIDHVRLRVDPEGTPGTIQAGPVRWEIPEDAEPHVATRLTSTADGPTVDVKAELTALQEVSLTAAVSICFNQGFGVVLFDHGIHQGMPERTGWVTSPSRFIAAYAIGRGAGSAALELIDTVPVVGQWGHGQDSFRLSLIVAGGFQAQEAFVPGEFELADHAKAVTIGRGESLSISFRLTLTGDNFPALSADAVDIPDDRLRAAHLTALWGTQVPSVGSLEIRGSAYPTINLPRREYGPLHTFFDPDAWSVTAALSYSGIAHLEKQAREIIERAISHISAEGLVPHHFDRYEPEYVAISGSPQPGPNLFLIESAINHACATGEEAWLLAAWSQGLRAAACWLLERMDAEHGLLLVDGALWVDVFRRSGYTLDSNAMAVRSFTRVSELARLAGDEELHMRFCQAAQEIRENISGLWSQDDTHFVTARGRDWHTLVDHMDTENYLAIATGAATPEQAGAIVDLFDHSPITHPGGRGTWVSLQRYDGQDCFGYNTGDSDIGMARHWWADLMARRALGDREMFWRLFQPVCDDLLSMVWMRERYATGGFMTRANGYHEYPDMVSMLIREAAYGLSLDLDSVDISPSIQGAFSVRYGRVGLEYSSSRVVLDIPSTRERRVTVHGLDSNRVFTSGSEAATTDALGTLVIRASGPRIVIAPQGAVSG